MKTLYLPSSLKIGTGFAYDSLRRRSTPQLDLIVYSDLIRSPIHRRGSFVIVDTHDVLATCEIKTTLTLKLLRDIIRKSIGCNMGRHPCMPIGVQKLCIFAFKCSISSKRIAKLVSELIDEYVANFCGSTIGGNPVQFSAYHLTLPSIFFYDRDEIIETHVASGDNGFACFRVSISKCFGPSGVGSLLATLAARAPSVSNERDFVHVLLEQPLGEINCKQTLALNQFISSNQLMASFPDAKQHLQLLRNKGHRIYGAYASCFVDLSEFSSFTHALPQLQLIDGERAFSKTPAENDDIQDYL